MGISIDEASVEAWRTAAYSANLSAEYLAVELTPRDVEALNLLLGRTPFKQLPLVTQAYMFLLYQTGKIWLYDAGGYRIMQCCWSKDGRYRVALPTTKPSIDWSVLKPEYKWLARDADGKVYVFGLKPSCLTAVWDSAQPYARVDGLVSYVPGDCDWQDSLVERPVNA